MIHFPGRPRSELRNQMVLNLARSDVKEYIFGVLDKLAGDYNIRYFKWDMNRAVSEPGWPEAGAVDERKLWVDYVRNLYEIIDRLRARHPKLEIESCSGGGGRIDLGILQRVDEVWPSDNTEAFDRLRIQEGFSMAYAPKIMSAWVTDVPNMNGRSAPLMFRFPDCDAGGAGGRGESESLDGAGFGDGDEDDRTLQADPRDGADRRSVPAVLAAHKRSDCEPVCRGGRQAGGGVCVPAYAAVQHGGADHPAARVGREGAVQVEATDGKLVERQPQLSGAYLMRVGLNVNLRADYDAAAIILERL